MKCDICWVGTIGLKTAWSQTNFQITYNDFSYILRFYKICHIEDSYNVMHKIEWWKTLVGCCLRTSLKVSWMSNQNYIFSRKSIKAENNCQNSKTEVQILKMFNFEIFERLWPHYGKKEWVRGFPGKTANYLSIGTLCSSHSILHYILPTLLVRSKVI